MAVKVDLYSECEGRIPVQGPMLEKVDVVMGSLLGKKACRHSLGVSRKTSTRLSQLLYVGAIPKEMSFFATKVANLGLALFVHLFHLL